jgi:hypothetical protein
LRGLDVCDTLRGWEFVILREWRYAMRNQGWVAAGFAAAMLTVAACGSSTGSNAGGSPSSATSSTPAASASGSLASRTVGGATVLTNAKGPVTAMSGITGKLGTIKRSDGSIQATYNGHPLYTFTGDTKPGQASGNGVTASGGLWHEVTVSGAAPATSSSSSSGGGGYGY